MEDKDIAPNAYMYSWSSLNGQKAMPVQLYFRTGIYSCTGVTFCPYDCITCMYLQYLAQYPRLPFSIFLFYKQLIILWSAPRNEGLYLFPLIYSLSADWKDDSSHQIYWARLFILYLYRTYFEKKKVAWYRYLVFGLWFVRHPRRILIAGKQTLMEILPPVMYLCAWSPFFNSLTRGIGQNCPNEVWRLIT